MAKLYATKLPDGMAAAFDDWLERNNMKAYTFFQQAAERAVTVIPPIPKKKNPPPIPRKATPPRMVTELMLKVNRFILEGVPRDDEVHQAIVAEMMRAPLDLPCWDDQVKKDLKRVRDELAGGLCMVADYRGIVTAADEDWRASLPTLKLGGKDPQE